MKKRKLTLPDVQDFSGAPILFKVDKAKLRESAGFEKDPERCAIACAALPALKPFGIVHVKVVRTLLYATKSDGTILRLKATGKTQKAISNFDDGNGFPEMIVEYGTPAKSDTLKAIRNRPPDVRGKERWKDPFTGISYPRTGARISKDFTRYRKKK